MKLKKVNTSNFESEVLSAAKPVLVKFTADWCQPCKSFEPLLEMVADEVADKAIVSSLDIDDSPEIASKYGVRSIPTLIVFSEGQVKSKLVGRASKENVLKLFDVIIEPLAVAIAE